MNIIIGYEAPSLIEQGFGDLVNCEKYQFLLDTLFKMLQEDRIDEEEYEVEVRAVVCSIFDDLSEMMEANSVLPVSDCVVIDNPSTAVH